MSTRPDPLSPRPPSSPPPNHHANSARGRRIRGSSSSMPSGRDVQRIAGAIIMAVGVLFTLYGAGSGLKKLVTVCLDNFGTVLLTSTIICIFFSMVIPIVGGIIANGVIAAGAIMVFGGLPAIPGVAITLGGAYLYLA